MDITTKIWIIRLAKYSSCIGFGYSATTVMPITPGSIVMMAMVVLYGALSRAEALYEVKRALGGK